jgi:hypothetical protein
VTCLVLAASSPVPTRLQAPGNWSWWRFSARPSFRAHRAGEPVSGRECSFRPAQQVRLNQQVRASSSRAVQGGHSSLSLPRVHGSISAASSKGISPDKPIEELP